MSEVNVVESINDYREKIVEKFMIPMNNDYKLSKNLEISCYNQALEYSNEKGIIKQWENPIFKQIYTRICISLFTNLDSDSYVKNNYLCNKILNGEISAYKAGSLKPNEMFPDNWTKMVQSKEKRDKLAYEVRMENVISGFDTCGKCKGDKVTFYERQTRSADEPMTRFITCINCGNKWKQ
jgi:DNA-directed RNA polymerase subunit M/transcription elongation factor TFIIS